LLCVPVSSETRNVGRRGDEPGCKTREAIRSAAMASVPAERLGRGSAPFREE
jgi:hypothetical protein